MPLDCVNGSLIFPGSFELTPRVLEGRESSAGPGYKFAKAAEAVEQSPMVAGIEQTMLAVLAMNFHKAVADLAQQPYTDRLIIDEGTASAVGTENAAQ